MGNGQWAKGNKRPAILFQRKFSGREENNRKQRTQNNPIAASTTF